MLRVRSVHDLDDFAGEPGDPPDYPHQVSSLWSSGTGRAEWCFVVDDGESRLGRVGFRVALTCDPQWLGTLPPHELFVYGLHLPWENDFTDPGTALISHGLAAIRSEVPDLLEVRINAETHPNPSERRQFAEALGMTLFQEKQGYVWLDDGVPIALPSRLRLRSLADVGDDEYRRVMARCGAGTLDRNDRYYWGGCGPENWASVMLTMADDDRDLWLLGYHDGQAIGYVGVSRVEEWGSTIAHIGVVPEFRGRGHIHELLAAGTGAAQRAGISSMLSDVDVDNTPMRQAMLRAGHRDDRRPWHLWVYRGRVDELSRI